MAGLEAWEPFVHVLGDSPPSTHTFPITVTTSDSVGNLRYRVFEKKHCRFKGVIDEDDLVLWKLNNPIPGEEADAGVAALGQNGQKLSESALLMLPTKSLELYFSSGVKNDSIHIIVQALDCTSADSDDAGPVQKRKRLPFGYLSDSIARRESTVCALYERLIRYRFILVRGTPASGKSTLALLLANHIHSVTPAVNPILIDSWPKGKSNWSARLPANYDSEGPNTIIIYEGQLTYWDTGFWTSFLKSIMSYPTLERVILFAQCSFHPNLPCYSTEPAR